MGNAVGGNADGPISVHGMWDLVRQFSYLNTLLYSGYQGEFRKMGNELMEDFFEIMSTNSYLDEKILEVTTMAGEEFRTVVDYTTVKAQALFDKNYPTINSSISQILDNGLDRTEDLLKVTFQNFRNMIEDGKVIAENFEEMITKSADDIKCVADSFILSLESIAFILYSEIVLGNSHSCFNETNYNIKNIIFPSNNYPKLYELMKCQITYGVTSNSTNGHHMYVNSLLQTRLESFICITKGSPFEEDFRNEKKKIEKRLKAQKILAKIDSTETKISDYTFCDSGMEQEENLFEKVEIFMKEFSHFLNTYINSNNTKIIESIIKKGPETILKLVSSFDSLNLESFSIIMKRIEGFLDEELLKTTKDTIKRFEKLIENFLELTQIQIIVIV